MTTFSVSVLWNEGDELLHGIIRRLTGTRCHGFSHLGPRSRFSPRASEVNVNQGPHETGGKEIGKNSETITTYNQLTTNIHNK